MSSRRSRRHSRHKSRTDFKRLKTVMDEINELIPYVKAIEEKKKPSKGKRRLQHKTKELRRIVKKLDKKRKKRNKKQFKLLLHEIKLLWLEIRKITVAVNEVKVGNGMLLAQFPQKDISECEPSTQMQLIQLENVKLKRSNEYLQLELSAKQQRIEGLTGEATDVVASDDESTDSTDESDDDVVTEHDKKSPEVSQLDLPELNERISQLEFELMNELGKIAL